ncbi:unnamed protein product [Lactuca saligna]|uniref:PPM-type phosphatase domain-containing protein n=1 Tax=Lactuca saligna TaxID=75948 RepID=A0AA35YU91_LACSI|nr:unnamed protein product [Lactuca saligna]
MSSQPSSSNCRQSVGYSAGKSNVVLARRRRTELRRLKVLSNTNHCLSNRRRFENTEKEHNDDFTYHSSVIGRMREMEDTACRERLHKQLAEEMDIGNRNSTEVKWENLMVESFSKMDKEVNETDLVDSMGSTAVVSVVSDKEIVVANCGDSRAVLSRGGATLPLSVDHKPDRPDELERIELSGGKVINWNGLRVLGVLATSRSIGNRQLKPYVIAKPEVTVNKRDDADEFMILASDGLWDVISNDLACQLVRKCLDGWTCRRRSVNKHHRRLTNNAAVFLTEMAMAHGSKDNISVIVVNLKR